MQSAVAYPSDFLDLEHPEQESLEYLAGYVVAQVKKTNSCENCRAAITGTAEASKLTVLKAYNKEKCALAFPSPAVLQVIEAAEGYVRANQEQLIANKLSLATLKGTIQGALSFGNCFPTCHKVGDAVIANFLKTRIRILVKRRNFVVSQSSQSSQRCGSRSVGMRVAANRIR